MIYSFVVTHDLFICSYSSIFIYSPLNFLKYLKSHNIVLFSCTWRRCKPGFKIFLFRGCKVCMKWKRFAQNLQLGTNMCLLHNFSNPLNKYKVIISPQHCPDCSTKIHDLTKLTCLSFAVYMVP